jgi:protein arginine kinase activator
LSVFFSAQGPLSEERCRECNAPATRKISKIIDGEVRDFYYCEDHAQQHHVYVPKAVKLESQEAIHELLKNLLAKSAEQGAEQEILREEETPHDGIVCANCGHSFGEYRKTLLLGCSECYTAFHELLERDLEKYHGATQHVGRRPGEKVQETDNRLFTLVELRKRMEQSITREDYTEAARLRDQIRLLEAEN